jgi:hypothetical protein
MLIKRRRDNFAVTPEGITRTQQSRTRIRRPKPFPQLGTSERIAA